MLFVVLAAALAQEPGHSALVDRVELVDNVARTEAVKTVVLHSTGGMDCNPELAYKGGTLSGIVRYFATRTDGIGVHYVVGRDGETVGMIPEDQVAYHVAGHNEASIGIELINDGDGTDPYPEAQIRATEELVLDIITRHGLTAESLTTHTALDTRHIECTREADGTWTTSTNSEGRGVPRRTDPGENFPLDRVRASLR